MIAWQIERKGIGTLPCTVHRMLIICLLKEINARLADWYLRGDKIMSRKLLLAVITTVTYTAKGIY